MPAIRVRATLLMLHTHGLSRSPQTDPINTEAADQTCWAAACAYAATRQKRPYLVAGVQYHDAPFGLQTRRNRWSGSCACALHRAAAHSCPRDIGQVPRNPLSPDLRVTDPTQMQVKGRAYAGIGHRHGSMLAWRVEGAITRAPASEYGTTRHHG